MTTKEQEFAQREAARIIAEHAEMKRLLRDVVDGDEGDYPIAEIRSLLAQIDRRAK